MNPLQDLEKMQQSIWLDFITRQFIADGKLAKLIKEEGVTGVTSNPTIFQKAIMGGKEYDETISRLVREGKTNDEIFDAVAIEDIQRACDEFRPIFDRTQGGDGFVSIEVNPHLARDTKATLEEARRLFRSVNRPNVMVKIPGTQEGLPAIEQALSEGININITLLFSVERYEKDPQGRLWLVWITIQDNHWESSLLKYKIAEDYERDGSPTWKVSEVLHIKPGAAFAATIQRDIERFRPHADDPKVKAFIDYALSASQDKLKSRLGWQTRGHPFILDGKRLILPLYSDGFNFSLMAITDDWGRTWHTSAPLVGPGNVQPTLVRRQDGSLYTVMRDNGGPPKRIQQASSTDRGETWSDVTDTDLPDPGAGLEIMSLSNGHWLLINNDTENGRHSLCVRVSDDEGKTWKWSRHLERSAPGPEAQTFAYPSLIQAKDGTLHATYSYTIPRTQAALDAQGRPRRETIKHAHFNEAWILEGDR